MKIAILSGKGGTGKTTLSTNLAYVSRYPLIDADIEEPNAAIFMKPQDVETQVVYNNFPIIDADKCTLCGKCGDFCQFNAILPAKDRVLIFKESCHDCGGCERVCPTGVIRYDKRAIGKIVKGVGENGVYVEYGELNIGELSGVKIIQALKHNTKECENLLIDSPPGAACAVMAALEDVDFVVLVTEPTPFGVSDMKIVVELLRGEAMPFGVVVNKSDLGNDEIYHYCETENIEILAKIPYDRAVSEQYSKGDILAKEPKYAEIFENLMSQLSQRGHYER